MSNHIPAQAPPAEPIRYFSRRLLAALEAMLTSPLTVVEAPTGYGKTVAVTEFLRKKPVRMIVTRAREDSPESFWPDFCRNLAREIPEAGDIRAALLALGLPRDYAQTRAALELLRQVPFPRETFLVFDDCHNLPHSFIDFCESLAAPKDALSNAHIVHISRDAGAGNGAVRARNALSCLDRNVFALTPPEICELYALHGVSLSPEAGNGLHAYTGGWISALFVSLLWYKEDTDVSAFPADILVHMKETIRKKVYAPLSGEAKELLLSLAPLERFTGFQAARMYTRDATGPLEELLRKNSFVTCDHASGFYSVHAIFRSFLLELFHDGAIVPLERKREIYRACGDALHESGELASAVEAWRQAGDFTRALAALEKHMTRNMVTERAGLYTAMFKECPEEILERHPGAAFKYAIAAFSAGDFAAFATQMQWLGKRCAALSSPGATGRRVAPLEQGGRAEGALLPEHPGDRRANTDEADRWRGELHVLLALKEFNDIEAMSRHHQAALDLLKGRTSLYGPDSPWTLGSPSVLFMFHRKSGKLREEVRLMRDCMPPYYQLTGHHGAGAEFLMEAEALYNAGEFDEAETLCRTALERASRREQLGNIFCALFLQMRLALLAGDAKALFGDKESAGLLADMRGLIARGRDFFLLHTADMCEGWLYAALGLYGKIPLWLRAQLGEDSPLYAFAKGYYYIVHGRALLLAGEYDTLPGQFSGMLQAGVFAKNLLFSVYAHIYLAAALHKTGESREAASALEIALDTALPDALYMPFAENYDLIGPVLAKALSGREHKEALSRVKTLAKHMKAGRETVLKEIQNPRQRFGLSPRESEVAFLVVEGFSNKKIAEKLHIKEGTVRDHLTQVYEKTGQSRTGLHKIFL